MSPGKVYKRRSKIAALPLYHSGPLLWTTSNKKDFKECYGELRGTTLFLYKHDAQENYTEKMDLEQLTSMRLKCPFMSKEPTVFFLTMRSKTLLLKMVDPGVGEEWRGYILTIAQKTIDRKLLLPLNQMQHLHEVLDQEKQRRSPSGDPPPPAVESIPALGAASPSDDPYAEVDTPECFFDVTRFQAETMLELNPTYGDIILRPSSQGPGQNYAVTFRQPRGNVVKHVKVLAKETGFVISLDEPVAAPSLNAVIEHIVTHFESRTAIRPYGFQLYHTSLGLPADSKSKRGAILTKTTPKSKPTAPVAPMQPTAAGPEQPAYEIPEDEKIAGFGSISPRGPQQDEMDAMMRTHLATRVTERGGNAQL